MPYNRICLFSFKAPFKKPFSINKKNNFFVKTYTTFFYITLLYFHSLTICSILFSTWFYSNAFSLDSLFLVHYVLVIYARGHKKVIWVVFLVPFFTPKHFPTTIYFTFFFFHSFFCLKCSLTLLVNVYS